MGGCGYHYRAWKRWSGHTKGPRWPDSIGKSGKYSSTLLIRWNFAATAICRLDKCFFFFPLSYCSVYEAWFQEYIQGFSLSSLNMDFFFLSFFLGRFYILVLRFLIDLPLKFSKEIKLDSVGRENHSIYHLWYINLTSPFSGRSCYLVMLHIVIFFSMVRVSLSWFIC